MSAHDTPLGFPGPATPLLVTPEEERRAQLARATQLAADAISDLNALAYEGSTLLDKDARADLGDAIFAAERVLSALRRRAT